PLAGLLDRVRAEFEGNAAGFADAFLDSLGELEVVPIARREIAPGLGDADDRPARLQFLKTDAEIEVALYIKRGHVGIGRVVEPGTRPQRRTSAIRTIFRV